MKEWYNDATAEDLTESHSKFLGILTVPEILTLCEAFGGTREYIPKNDEVYNQVVRNRKIRESYRKGVTAAKLAVRYGISESTVTRVVQGCLPGQISLFDEGQNVG
jgi:Mor family transcriptional regulator